MCEHCYHHRYDDEVKICTSENCTNLRDKKGTRCGPCRNSIHRYGLTVPQREKMLEEQNYLCRICSCIIKFDGSARQTAACVDHNHKTGNVRGILCGNCNTWVGFVENRSIDLDLVKKYICSQLSWIEHRPSKPTVRGSNPLGQAQKIFENLYLICCHLSSVGRALFAPQFKSGRWHLQNGTHLEIGYFC